MSLLNIAILLGVLTTLTAAATDPSNVSLQLMTSAYLEKFLQENPDAQPRSTQTEEVAEGKAYTSYQIFYTIGQRVSDDKVVFSGSKNNSWPTKQYVRLLIIYPAVATGAIVSYCNITVIQSSHSGRAHVVSGGIGQRHITIAVEAHKTLLFNYSFSIYGKS